MKGICLFIYFFDVYVARKKSLFLTIGVFFVLHDAVAAFLCTSSAFPLIISTLSSIVEVANGTSFRFKLIGGIWLTKDLLLCAP
jgi:hypothetical protein